MSLWKTLWNHFAQNWRSALIENNCNERSEFGSLHNEKTWHNCWKLWNRAVAVNDIWPLVTTARSDQSLFNKGKHLIYNKFVLPLSRRNSTIHYLLYGCGCMLACLDHRVPRVIFGNYINLCVMLIHIIVPMLFIFCYSQCIVWMSYHNWFNYARFFMDYRLHISYHTEVKDGRLMSFWGR